MADVSAESIERVRAQIKSLLCRVPSKVNNGGHGTAVAYKNDAIKANKALASSRSNLLVLSTAYQSLLSYQ